MKHFILIILTMTIFSCKKEIEKGEAFTFNKAGGAPVLPSKPTGFTLLTPASSPGFISTPTLVVSGLVSVSSIKLYRNETCSIEVASAQVSSASVSLKTISLPVGVHVFYAVTSNKYGTSGCSGALGNYQYLGAAPSSPSRVELQNPTSSPGTISTPTIFLYGVVGGETTRIYRNSICTDLYGTVVASGTTASVTLKQLAPGVHIFYTTTTNTAGTTACSQGMLTYDYTGVLPSTAATLTLFYPSTSPNYDSTPTMTATGVANGDTVNIYTNASCTTFVGSALATTNTVRVTTNTLTIGSYTFYTNTSNIRGTSACSSGLVLYNFTALPPNVNVSWTANHESAVNRTGGGYRIYFSSTSNFNAATALYVDVPYVSGPLTPTSRVFDDLVKGNNYFKVAAYSSLNAPGSTAGSISAPSAEFSVFLP